MQNYSDSRNFMAPEPKPATEFYLTIDDYGVLVVQYTGTNNQADITRTIRDAHDFNQFFAAKANEAGVALDDLTVMSSSSLDFPEEWTTDPDVIALAHAIRG